MDKVGTTDHVAATLETEVVEPEYPCPECGKATKDNNNRTAKRLKMKIRICSSTTCRYEADWSSGTPNADFKMPEPSDEDAERW